MKFVKYSSIVLVTFVIIAGIAIPTVRAPQGLFEFPTIPGLGQKSRNIFFHVPVAWTTVVAFLVSMYYGFRYVRTKNMEYDIKSVSSAGLGFLFCFLATVTGAIWAKFNWGDYWNWDPRETSIFILLLIYGAYFALRSALENEEVRARLSAVYSMVAGLTVPFFIFVMPRMMAGLHPGAKGDVEGKGPVLELKMSSNMLVVFLVALVAFNLLYVWLLDLRVRAGKLEYEQSREQSR
ncbi:MAG: cytochrome c biogenesis protein CcsA [Ignavibacteriales bacterium]|nr:cytochrome c biogenesis protein CcsA [Ignavibacteriales bacterium]